MSSEKALLRLKYKEIRQKEKDICKDKAIAEKVIGSSFFRDSDSVLIYSSVGSEAETSAVIIRALKLGKTVALPVCLDKNGHMEFYAVNCEGDFAHKGTFSIPEPDVNICKVFEADSHSVCIVPGLAFDRNGYRLGYGKGYYDRFLSSFKGVAVGLCYEGCFCDELPCDCFDCNVDVIITENNIYSVNKEEYING